MSIAALVPKGALKDKPPHGAPCNRCGLCCMATLCPLAQHVFRRSERGPCPALTRDADGLSVCGLIAEPMKHARVVAMTHGVEATGAAAAVLNGAGTGCDARFEGEPINEQFYEQLREHDRVNASKVRRARKLWGVRT